MRKPKHDDAEQSRRFVETARELGADETEAAFDETFRKLIPVRQPDPEKKK